ncbi:MAG: F0F1 ATP synthase subunit B [Candidatus Moranbacteria bacterium]|jgi:F-type H+-transporting ATPase subunit b|nr:F0F1 ATP synthase subunit B [Candidatus Moranbacteria bacterium]
MEVLSSLGINSKLLLAQIVNFFILLYVLKRFAYGPILKMLEERSQKIEKGVADAEGATEKLKEIEKKEKKVLSDARKESQKIIAAAEEIAEKNKKEIIQQSEEQSEKIIAEAKKKIEEEKNRMMAEIKNEIAVLVVAATEKVIQEKMNIERDREIIEKAIQ